MAKNVFISGMMTIGLLGLLHIEITHFDSVASVVITKVASVALCSQVSQVLKKEYYHDAYVVHIMT
jgi:hypothetical protein